MTRKTVSRKVDKGRVKQKRAYEHAQNAQIQIILRILRMHKVSSGPCSPFIHSEVFNGFVRGQWWPWCGCTGWSGPSLSAYARRRFRTFSYALHYENKPIQIYWKFYHQKWKLSDKNSDIFHISARNIDCEYSLEPPHRVPTIYVLDRNKKINVYPWKPQFYYIKVVFKGVNIILACFRDMFQIQHS